MTRTIRILFTASVLLNLLLLGAGAGFVIDKMQHDSWKKMTENLKPETQNLMARAFQHSRNEMNPIIKEMKESRAEMARIFSDEEFNEEKFTAALERMMNAQRKLMEERFEATKQLGQELPLAERKKLGEMLSKPYGGFGHGKRYYDHPPKPKNQD